MSEIDYGKIRNITARELERALLRDDFLARRQRSHRRFIHPDDRRVTVSRTRGGDTSPLARSGA